jgi:uncharacterized protein YjbJ (UPF0337 family)
VGEIGNASDKAFGAEKQKVGEPTGNRELRAQGPAQHTAGYA